MKILLLGDFSAVHLNLKTGLQELGHEVVLVSKGDGFKKLPADIVLYTRQSGSGKLVGAFKEIRDQLRVFPQLKNFDVVQTASYQFFHNRVDSRLFGRLLDNNKHSVLLNTACSVPYNRLVKQIDYSPCAQCKLYDLTSHQCIHEADQQEQKEFSLYQKYSAIVSTHFEYYEGMQKTPFRQKNHFIPLPLDVDKYIPVMPAVNDKIVIYYGEIRKGFKGGAYIEEALDLLRNSAYANRVEIIQTSRLPYTEYLNVLDKAHILIDQASSYSYGMNAIIGLAKGKIVLSGAETQSLQMLGENPAQNPVFNIKPDKENIFHTLTGLLDRWNEFGKISENSRRFAEQYHSVKKVAARYEQLYLQLP